MDRVGSSLFIVPPIRMAKIRRVHRNCCALGCHASKVVAELIVRPWDQQKVLTKQEMGKVVAKNSPGLATQESASHMTHFCLTDSAKQKGWTSKVK